MAARVKDPGLEVTSVRPRGSVYCVGSKFMYLHIFKQLFGGKLDFGSGKCNVSKAAGFVKGYITDRLSIKAHF